MTSLSRRDAVFFTAAEKRLEFCFGVCAFNCASSIEGFRVRAEIVTKVGVFFLDGWVCPIFETIDRTLRVMIFTEATAVEVIEATRGLTVSAYR